MYVHVSILYIVSVTVHYSITDIHQKLASCSSADEVQMAYGYYDIPPLTTVTTHSHHVETAVHTYLPEFWASQFALQPTKKNTKMTDGEYISLVLPQ